MYKGRPIIALMPLYDEKKDSYWMLPGYMEALEEQGAIPLMPPLNADRTQLDFFLEECDGFVLTGGQDISPRLYGQEPSARCGLTLPLRDDMDAYVLKGAVQRDKAVLGICRGHQLMNAVYGGTLYQDIPAECPSEVDHRMQPPYDGCAHMVRLETESPLARLLESEELAVNSCHHQAIRELAAPFRAMAVAPDGLIEAIYMPEKRFVWGVQWHPEFSYQVNQGSRKIFAAFLESARTA